MATTRADLERDDDLALQARTPTEQIVATSSHSLRDRHRHELLVESAISPDILAEEGVRTVAGPYELPEPDPALSHPNPAKARRFGRHPDVLGGGIYFPIRDAEGRLTYQLKPDRPRSRNGKVVRYESPPGTRLVVHVPTRVRPVLRDPSVPLRLTEGPKKVLAATGAGYPTIGLMGVSGWKVRLDDDASVPLPDLDDVEWRGRIVYIEFDSDVAVKASVRDALAALRRELQRRGAMPITVILPDGPNGEKQGVDDFLAAGGDLRALENGALFKALAGADVAPRGGSHGAETCRGCTALREQIAEYKAELHLLRSGAVSPGEAMGLSQLASIAASARSRGEMTASLFVPEVARVAGIGGGTAERPRLRMLRALGRLPRDAARPKHGGDRRCPRHPTAPVVRTTIWRCTVDECGWTNQETVNLGAHRHQDETVTRSGDVTVLHGASFWAEVRAEGDRRQDGPQGEECPRHQDGAGDALVPVSFVSRADVELAAGPRRATIPDDDDAADLTGDRHQDGAGARSTAPDPPEEALPACIRSGCDRPKAPPDYPFLCEPCGQEARIAAAAYAAEQPPDGQDGEPPFLGETGDGPPAAGDSVSFRGQAWTVEAVVDDTVTLFRPSASQQPAKPTYGRPPGRRKEVGVAEVTVTGRAVPRFEAGGSP